MGEREERKEGKSQCTDPKYARCRRQSATSNSFTRSSSGVTVAHLMPTLYLRIASEDSTVTRSLVWERGREGYAGIQGSQGADRNSMSHIMSSSAYGDTYMGRCSGVLHRGTREQGQNT
jgi:hypothetical protein